MGANTGWVGVGTDHETAAFAVNTLRAWWNTHGRRTYPDTDHLLITADSGGSNGNRRRTATGLAVTATLDTGSYPTGIKISDREMTALPITRDEFHGDWNYTLHPTRNTPEPS